MNRTKLSAPYLSIVVPFYNEEENVHRLWQRLRDVVKAYGKSYQVIFVDDGSSDKTRQFVIDLANQEKAVSAILFRANFGQSAAMAAGFAHTRGQVVIAMDGDLQNDPADIPVLVEKLEQGYDVVAGWRKNRKDKLLVRKIPSKIANRIICSTTGVFLHDTGCSLKAFRGEMLRNISLYGELHRFIPALMRMEGANITELAVHHHARKYGKSKYNLTRTFRVILDLTTIRLLMRHLKNPLSFFAAFSFFFLFSGLVAFSYGFYKVMILDVPFEQVNILLTITVLLIASGLQFLFLGLIGRMVVESGSRRSLY
ncbi:glycosyltransferase [candidate division KSB1 bacterium]|nr:glycosyltransferase [candidate division KSB1 bacterium]